MAETGRRAPAFPPLGSWFRSNLHRYKNTRTLCHKPSLTWEVIVLGLPHSPWSERCPCAPGAAEKAVGWCILAVGLGSRVWVGQGRRRGSLPVALALSVLSLWTALGMSRPVLAPVPRAAFYSTQRERVRDRQGGRTGGHSERLWPVLPAGWGAVRGGPLPGPVLSGAHSRPAEPFWTREKSRILFTSHCLRTEGEPWPGLSG